jgi:GNAT superfamily N-acetyltransferase
VDPDGTRPQFAEFARRLRASLSAIRQRHSAISGPEVLTAAHDVADFSCGKPSLDRWLKTRALSNQQKGFTAVLVVHEANRVIGYHGLAPTAIVPHSDRPAARPCRCLLLGQLATDQNWIGKGIRAGLLRHALQRCVTAAGLIGGRALIVNAVNVEAAAFWTRCGFIPSKDDPLILFRSIADIAASLC